MSRLPASVPVAPIPAWQRLLWWLALCSYLALLLTATHLPKPPLQHFPVRNDKILHMLAYCGLGFLLGLRTMQTWRKTLAFWVILQSIAALDELTQPWFRRQTDIYDWLSDGLGGAVGLASGLLLQSLVRELARRWAHPWNSWQPVTPPTSAPQRRPLSTATDSATRLEVASPRVS